MCFKLHCTCKLPAKYKKVQIFIKYLILSPPDKIIFHLGFPRKKLQLHFVFCASCNYLNEEGGCYSIANEIKTWIQLKIIKKLINIIIIIFFFIEPLPNRIIYQSLYLPIILPIIDDLNMTKKTIITTKGYLFSY